MKIYDTKIYKEYFKNIEISKNSVIITDGFIGDNLLVEIIDHNFKKPKKKTLKGECLEIATCENLDNSIYDLVNNYVYTQVKLLAKSEIRQTVIENWKEWKGGKKYGQRRTSKKQNAEDS